MIIHAKSLPPSALHKLYKWIKTRRRVFSPNFGSLAKRKEEMRVSSTTSLHRSVSTEKKEKKHFFLKKNIFFYFFLLLHPPPLLPTGLIRDPDPSLLVLSGIGGRNSLEGEKTRPENSGSGNAKTEIKGKL